ncbi:MAG: hypothetical protein WC464_03285 [Bdellovibrionales bacterium]
MKNNDFANPVRGGVNVLRDMIQELTGRKMGKEPLFEKAGELAAGLNKNLIDPLFLAAVGIITGMGDANRFDATAAPVAARPNYGNGQVFRLVPGRGAEKYTHR